MIRLYGTRYMGTNRKQLFRKSIKHIRQDDLSNLLKVLKKAEKKNIDLSTLVDSDGNSMLHYLLMQENIELYKVAKQFYPTSWGQLKLEFKLSNRFGVRPCDLFNAIQDKSFKDGVIQVGQHQGHLLRQFRLYLDCQTALYPSKYDRDEVKILRSSLEKGHCHGFALLFIEYFFKSGIERYEAMFYNIIHWNGQFDDLDQGLIYEFEYLFGIILQYQCSDHTLRNIPHKQENFKTWQQSIIWNRTASIETKQIRVAKILGIDSYQEEGLIKIDLHPKNSKRDCGVKAIEKLFHQLKKHPVNMGKALCITGGEGHTLVAIFTENAFILFDSNYRDDSLQDFKPYKCFELSPTKIIAQQIYQQIYGMLDPHESKQIEIIPIGVRGSEYGCYYKDELDWLKLYREIRGQKNELRLGFVDFVKYVRYFDKNLNDFELKNFYESILINDLDGIYSLKILSSSASIHCILSQLSEQKMMGIFIHDLSTMKVNYVFNELAENSLNYMYEFFKFSLSYNIGSIFRDDVLSKILLVGSEYLLSMFISFRAHYMGIDMPVLLTEFESDLSAMLRWPIEAQYLLILYLVKRQDMPFKKELLHRDPYDDVLFEIESYMLNLKKEELSQLLRDITCGTDEAMSLLELYKLPDRKALNDVVKQICPTQLSCVFH